MCPVNYKAYSFLLATREVPSQFSFNSFTEIQFIYCTVHPFKIYSSVGCFFFFFFFFVCSQGFIATTVEFSAILPEIDLTFLYRSPHVLRVTALHITILFYLAYELLAARLGCTTACNLSQLAFSCLSLR